MARSESRVEGWVVRRSAKAVARRSVNKETAWMIHLGESPRLIWPTTAVRNSYLLGERADCVLQGTPTDWLGPASEDFDGFVAQRRGVQTRWNVPSTIFWYISGEHYLGTLVV